MELHIRAMGSHLSYDITPDVEIDLASWIE